MRSKLFLFIQIGLVFLILFIIYHILFSTSLLSDGDFPYYYQKMLLEFPFTLFAWGAAGNNGLGNFSPPISWPFFLFEVPTAFLATFFHLSWNSIGRLLYFFPFLIIGIVSIFVLLKNFFPKNKFIPLTILFYLSNTYILLLVGGGQLLYVVGYSFVPIVLWSHIRMVGNKGIAIKDILLTGFLAGLLLMIDPRIFYMSVIIVVLYWLIFSVTAYEKSYVTNIRKLLTVFASFIICGLLNSFWIIPTIFARDNTITSTIKAYVPQSSVQYFSFAKFENTISLLHPNWPENIFGKVYFMRWEFLLIPILAFSSLLFLKSRVKGQKSEAQAKNQKLDNNGSIEQSDNRIILFFALLGLIGAFLAKGANEPFGGMYLWMFQHVPGFVMFRDPTKWYTLVALSYSVLIPFSIWKIYEWLTLHKKISLFNFQFPINSKNKIFNAQNIFVLLVIAFWLFTIRQAVLGQLGGTFKATTVPAEYTVFANYLSSQQQFSRTLWVPTTQRFGFSSQNHPAVSAEDLFNVYDVNTLMKKLHQPGIENLLQEMSVKYVVVPTDSQKEIFLNNRVYSDTFYKKTVSDIAKIMWLKPDDKMAKLAVFMVPNPKDHFWSPQSSVKIHYSYINPVTYKVKVTNAQKGDRLVFSENYDSHWEAKIGNSQVSSVKYKGKFNSFMLPKGGNYTLDIYYTPQKWVNIGVLISLGTVVVLLGSLFIVTFRKKDL